jgi:hypothetical protein
LEPILLPLIATSPTAFMLILPLPSIVMFLPFIVIVPSFFIVMLELAGLEGDAVATVDDELFADGQ